VIGEAFGRTISEIPRNLPGDFSFFIMVRFLILNKRKNCRDDEVLIREEKT